MTRTFRRILPVVILLCIMHVAPAAASDRGESLTRIRTDDRHLQQLLHEGMLRSPTVRALAERIEHSDVVVYLLCDVDPRARVVGRMTFVSAVGGVRYLAVRLAPLRSRAHQIAVLAHELRHAVEVADTPAIVDTASMAREYTRFGHINHQSSSPGALAFDTQAAIAAGRQALDELVAVNGD